MRSIRWSGNLNRTATLKPRIGRSRYVTKVLSAVPICPELVIGLAREPNLSRRAKCSLPSPIRSSVHINYKRLPAAVGDVSADGKKILLRLFD